MNKVVKGAALASASLILGSIVVPTATQAATYKTINWTETAQLGTMDQAKSSAAVDFDAMQAIGDGLYRNDKNSTPHNWHWLNQLKSQMMV